MSKGFLAKTYTARDARQTRAHYDDWAETYDAEVSGQGYVTPDRCAQALAEHMPDLAAPVLDFGCGTGLSGMALTRAGFTTLDGIDLSAEMLEQAAARGIYRATRLTEPDAALPLKPGDYAAIAAIGVIGAGAAAIAVFDQLVAALGPGGRLVWSFNDHTLQDPANEAAVQASLDSGATRLLFKEHGPHLTDMEMGSTVYVIEKT